MLKEGKLLYAFPGLLGIILEPSFLWHKIRRLHIGIQYTD